MKKLNLILASLMFSPCLAWADQVLVAAADNKTRWSTEQLDNDGLLQRRACLAGILSDRGLGARLETVVLYDNQQSTLSPFIRVQTQGAGEFFSGVLTVTSKAGKKSFELTRGTFNADGGDRVALGLLDDRANLIQALKAGSRADLTLNRGTQKVATASFSLSGSTAAVDALKNCR